VTGYPRDRRVLLGAALAILLAAQPLAVGCASSAGAGNPAPPPPPVAEQAFTLGLVQKEIRVGMSQTDVAEALGSPNIVTRDSEGKEAWVYDKIATEARYSKSSIGAGGGGGVNPASVLVLGLVGGSKESGQSTTSQRTLTVIIKFDTAGAVDSFSFHASRF